MRTLLLGARSQLGHDILRAWPADAITALDRRQCDITDARAVSAAVATACPDLVINLAASHRVDDVERDPDSALRVNCHGSWLVARAAADAGAAVLWISTDYVFAGDRTQPYTESDPPAPINVYGASKAAGERLVALANPRHYIVRTSGLYGLAGSSGKGGNFVETMLRRARERQPLRVVDDQVLGMTSTRDLAAALYGLVGTDAYGMYHVTNEGALSWFEFAATIFALAGVAADLQPTSTEAFGAPARRPAYSVLANDNLMALGLPRPRPIAEALAEYLRMVGKRD